MSRPLFSENPDRNASLLAWLVDQQLRSLTPHNPSYCPTPLPPVDPAHGIVIGIDYDLGYQLDEEILADWQGYLPPDPLRLLAPAGGLKGPTAAHYYGTLPEIMIPWDTAFRFFQEKTMPRWLVQAAKIWPHFARLSPEQRCALTSLIMHLGTGLGGKNRGELALIARYLSAGKTAPIPSLIRSLAQGTRSWTRQVRLLAEADLFESAPTSSSSSS